MGAKGSRKALADTALNTANSGYLTRRLVDVSQEVIVREEKCDTNKGAWVQTIYDDKSGSVLEPLSERIVGRYTIGQVQDANGNVIVEDDEMITEEQAKAIEAAGIKGVNIRTVIQCHAKNGICAHCYGADLASGKKVKIGEAVGIIAAQSIGEPGTQLTMRTFHTGGVAGSDITQGLPRVEELFEARTPKSPVVMTEFDGVVHVLDGDAPGSNVVAIHSEGIEVARYPIHSGLKLCVKNGDEVKAQKMYDLCEQYGWVPISMKNDWKTIYGDGVTRK